MGFFQQLFVSFFQILSSCVSALFISTLTYLHCVAIFLEFLRLFHVRFGDILFLDETLKVVIGVPLMVYLGFQFRPRELIDFRGGEIICTGQLNEPLFVLVKNGNIDMLVTKLAQFDGFLQ